MILSYTFALGYSQNHACVKFTHGIHRHFQQPVRAEMISTQLSLLQVSQAGWNVVVGALFQRSWVPCWGAEGIPGELVNEGPFYKLSSDTASVDFLGKVPKAGLLVSMAATAVVVVAFTDVICRKFTGRDSK